MNAVLPFRKSKRNCQLTQAQIGDCRVVVLAVSQSSGVNYEDFFAPSRRHMKTANARQLAMYLCHVLTGLTMTEVGAFFGRDRTTVSHACALIEDSREERRTDDHIQGLEDRVVRMRRSVHVEKSASSGGYAHA